MCTSTLPPDTRQAETSVKPLEENACIEFGGDWAAPAAAAARTVWWAFEGDVEL